MDTAAPARSTFDEGDEKELIRTIAAGAICGGLTFVRAKVGDAAFARAMSQVRLREPIARLVGPVPLAERSEDRAVERSIDVVDERKPPPLPERVANDQRSPPSEPPAAPSRFLDEKQLCAELDISPVTATKWRRNAEGPPFVRVGRLIRYPRESFNAWLTSRTVGLPRSTR